MSVFGPVELAGMPNASNSRNKKTAWSISFAQGDQQCLNLIFTRPYGGERRTITTLSKESSPATVFLHIQ
jgi:hypothetical protein